MSPSGSREQDAEARDIVSPSVSVRSESEAQSRALPLRLSVARGGLGLELCDIVDLGPLVVEELEVALPGLNYPLDLSKGVKQFRNRRSSLRHAVVRLDLRALGLAWAETIRDIWGAPVSVRLRPILEPEPEARSENDATAAFAVSVSIHSEDAVIAFDLVITSGLSPRVVIDAPRIHGRAEPALLLAFRLIDAGLAATSGQIGALTRKGRAIEISGFSQALGLLVLPRLGCRLPQVEGQVIRRVEFVQGALRLVLGAQQEPFTAGRRALRVGGFADHLIEADSLLGKGDLAGARRAYLSCLEGAPGHPEILQVLADIDIAAGDRGEAALSFLQELEAALPPGAASDSTSRLHLATGRALRVTGREELVAETWARSVSVETDAVLAALLGSDLATMEASDDAARSRLDRAVARAPFLRKPRLQRLHLAIKAGDLRTATADAEQLEASQATPQDRAEICVLSGEAFLAAGLRDEAQKWLRRALRLHPEDPFAMVALAKCLSDLGEGLRAAELLQTALRRSALMLESASEADMAVRVDNRGCEDLRKLQSAARFRLAHLLLEISGDIPQVLGLLSSVDSRSPFGAEARLMEAELHAKSGSPARRDRALARLLEAVEMGWINWRPHRKRLLRLIDEAQRDADPSVLDFASRVLALDERD